MRVKLQLVMCNDTGDEETVTDVITLNKNTKRPPAESWWVQKVSADSTAD
jgi:hypothetical protein